MTPELIGIILAALTLSGLIITNNRGLRQDIREQARVLGEVRDRLSHLDGLIQGLVQARSILPIQESLDEQERAA